MHNVWTTQSHWELYIPLNIVCGLAWIIVCQEVQYPKSCNAHSKAVKIHKQEINCRNIICSFTFPYIDHISFITVMNQCSLKVLDEHGYGISLKANARFSNQNFIYKCRKYYRIVSIYLLRLEENC